MSSAESNESFSTVIAWNRVSKVAFQCFHLTMDSLTMFALRYSAV